MRTISIRIMLSFLGLIVAFNYSHAQFAGGTGIETDPWQITTLVQLNAVRNNSSAHYILMNNLVFTDIDDLNGDQEGNFTSINSFTGIFEGNGKTIKGLANSDGLFQTISYGGAVRNLGVVDCNITGNSNAGSIAAYNGGEITTCFSTGTITGNQNIGGIAGVCSYGSITACYNAATINAPDGKNIGGIAGSITRAYLNTCFNTGTLTGQSAVGGIAGKVESGIMANCYFLSGTTSAGIGAKPDKYIDETIAISDADMKASGFTNRLNNPFLVSFWKANAGNFPTLTWQSTGAVPTPKGTINDPYLISSLQELSKTGNYIMMYNYFKLVNDLDFGTTDLNGANAGNFNPIGIGIPGDGFRFWGNFDGNNKSITGLIVDQEATGNYAGLFGYAGLGIIKNLSLKNASIKGKNSVGGIVGSFDGGKAILNCSFEGTVQGQSAVGGLIGSASYIDSIKCCTNTGTIIGANNVGGIAGGVFNGASVTAQIAYCVNKGNIQTNQNHTAGDRFGGLFGGIQAVEIAYCHNSGNVTATTSNNVAGLVAYANVGKLLACYNEGNVTGKNSVSGIGVKASACYNTGNVTGERYVGGIIGGNPSDLGVIPWTKWGNSDGASGTYSTPYIVACYNTGLVTGKQDVDGVCSHKYSSIGSFYIDGKVVSGEKNNMFEIEEGAQPITETQMKSVVVLNALNLAMKSSSDYWFYTLGDFPKLTESSGSALTTQTVSIAIAPFGVPIEIDGIRFNTTVGTYHQIKLPEGTYKYKIADYAESTAQTTTIASGYNNINLNTGITSIQGVRGKIYQLSTPEHLHLVRYANSSDFILNNDIRFESNHDFSRTEGNFYPIRYYDGLFNGNNHTISGLNIQKDSLENVGFFAEVNAKEGRNFQSGILKLGIVNCNIKGKTNVGAIAGNADFNVPYYGCKIDSCYASGTVVGYEKVGGLFGIGSAPTLHSYNLCTVTGIRYVGGIAGSATSGDMTECYNKGAITGYGTCIGGLAGSFGNHAKGCYNVGEITVPSDTAKYVGGLAGTLVSGWHPANMYGSQAGSFTDCYNAGNITANSGMYIGGITGICSASSSIVSSYNSGKITNSGGSLAVGGLAGYGDDFEITASYNAGEIIVTENPAIMIGGIIGDINLGKIKSTYNTADLHDLKQSGHTVGGVAGRLFTTNTKLSKINPPVVTRSFYWQENDTNPAIPGIGNVGEVCNRWTGDGIVVDTTKAMSAVDMRKSDLVDSLNIVLTEPAWKMDLATHINSGFPILLWQKESTGSSIPETKLSSESEWKIYPNPVTDHIFFNNLPGNATIHIVNINGKVVINNRIDTSQMDVSHLSAGLYLLQIILPEGKVSTQKFIKK